MEIVFYIEFVVTNGDQDLPGGIAEKVIKDMPFIPPSDTVVETSVWPNPAHIRGVTLDLDKPRVSISLGKEFCRDEEHLRDEMERYRGAGWLVTPSKSEDD